MKINIFRTFALISLLLLPLLMGCGKTAKNTQSGGDISARQERANKAGQSGM